MNSEIYNNNIENVETKKYGMRWYKFITYFLFPFYALIGIIVSVVFMPGVIDKIIDIDSVSNIEIKLFLLDLFNLYDDLRIANLLCALGNVALAFYDIYISVSLHKFKKSAPKHVSVEYILSGALNIIYVVISLIIMRETVDFNAKIIITLIRNFAQTIGSTVIWVLIYNKYFNKRKHLFVN